MTVLKKVLSQHFCAIMMVFLDGSGAGKLKSIFHQAFLGCVGADNEIDFVLRPIYVFFNNPRV